MRVVIIAAVVLAALLYLRWVNAGRAWGDGIAFFPWQRVGPREPAPGMIVGPIRAPGVLPPFKAPAVVDRTATTNGLARAWV